MVAISFTANHIKDLQVLRINQNNVAPQKVSFIEFSPTDIETLNDFRESIYGDRVYRKQSFRDARIYGLTTQLDSFEKIDYKKILGLIKVEDDPKFITSIRIRHDAMTPPKTTFMDKIFFGEINNRKYKKVGTALLDGLKSVNDYLLVFSPKKLVGFFKQNGFWNPRPNHKKYLTWVKK